MELVLSTQRLADTGGAQTYAITVGEHLARLGHSVTLYTRELGIMAEQARERALRVTATAEELPSQADGVIAGVDRGLGMELVARYPRAARVFVVHGADDVHLPPPVPGAFAATIVLNDLHAARAAACVGAGEVVRLRQPVDLRRFSPRGTPGERPRRVLLLGNYHSGPTERASILREAWADADLQWSETGGATQTLDVPRAIAQADVVVGYGRSMLEAMACGRLAYVHDRAGSEGWITPKSYARMEAGGFAVAAARLPPTVEELRADLHSYRAEWGRTGQDIARTQHDARGHAAALVALLERHAPGRPCGEPSTLRALSQLAESQLRAEIMVDHYRIESGQWFTLYHGKQEEMARERGAWELERQAWQAQREASEAERAELHARCAHAGEAAALAEGRLDAFRRTRRYRLAQMLAGPLERWRRRRYFK